MAFWHFFRSPLPLRGFSAPGTRQLYVLDFCGIHKRRLRLRSTDVSCCPHLYVKELSRSHSLPFEVRAHERADLLLVATGLVEWALRLGRNVYVYCLFPAPVGCTPTPPPSHSVRNGATAEKPYHTAPRLLPLSPLFPFGNLSENEISHHLLLLAAATLRIAEALADPNPTFSLPCPLVRI